MPRDTTTQNIPIRLFFTIAAPPPSAQEADPDAVLDPPPPGHAATGEFAQSIVTSRPGVRRGYRDTICAPRRRLATLRFPGTRFMKRLRSGWSHDRQLSLEPVEILLPTSRTRQARLGRDARFLQPLLAFPATDSPPKGAGVTLSGCAAIRSQHCQAEQSSGVPYLHHWFHRRPRPCRCRCPHR